MTRKPRHDPEQLRLFATTIPQNVNAKSSISWAAKHWPQYLSGRGEDLQMGSASLWTESFFHLPKGAQKLLLCLGREAAGATSCRMCLPALAQANEMGRNTCKRHLEKLLAAGLVMMKSWSEPTSRGPRLLGYEFRLIVDPEDCATAIAEGFVSSRPMARAHD